MGDDFCPVCAFGASHYPFLVRVRESYAITLFNAVPQRQRLFFMSEDPTEWVILRIFLRSPLKVRPYDIDGYFNTDLERDHEPDGSDIEGYPHGSYMQNPQERIFVVVLRGGYEATTKGANLVFLQTIEVVKVSMNVEVPVAEFDQVDFASNLATLLGIDPSRIRVADVRPVRRLLGRTLRCI